MKRRSQGAKKTKQKKPKLEEQEQPEVAVGKAYYCIVPSEKRFGLLATFLRKNGKKKILVVFSTYQSLHFHSEAFTALGIPNSTIHEKQDDEKVSTTLDRFESSASGLLLSTEATVHDLVVPPVDWLLQYEPLNDVEKYKQQSSQGYNNNKHLLFLLPQEFELLKGAKDSYVQCEFSDVKTSNLQSQMEKLVQKNYRIYQLSLEAYRAYIQAYASHPVKDAFNLKKLNLQAASASFGIKCPPKIATT